MHFIPVLLPILCFAALLRLDNFRESFLKSAVVCAVFIAFSSEFLSLFHALSLLPLAACWFLFLLVLLVLRYRPRITAPGSLAESAPARPELVQEGHRLFAKKSTNLPLNVQLALICAIVIVSGITAVVAAPNNFDSLTYHLPRVMHWIQNRSVAHYPTNIDRQLGMAPFSEYVIMHLQILSGSDRFANCVQWFAMVGSVLGVSLIARAFKASVSAQVVSAAIAVSVPMGLLQSTSTQNDYTVTFWLVCLACFIVEGKERGAECGGDLLRRRLSPLAPWVALSLALAIFTKGTAYFIAAPFMLLYLWQVAGRGVKRGAADLVIVAVAVLLINGGHLYRNFETFGDPLAHGSGNDIICKRIDLTSIVSCVTRNIATQFSTGLPKVDRSLYRTTDSIHHMIGVDINDHDITADDDFVILGALVRNHEDYAPNPAHMLLLLASAALLAVRCKKVPRDIILYAAAGMLGFLFLSAFMKWTPYLSRYFLPVFVLAAPVTGYLSDAAKPRALVHACAMALLVWSFCVLNNNFMRPLSGPRSIFVTDRLSQYFMARPEAVTYFVSLANTVKGQPNTNVGVINGNGNMLEYLLWVVLNDGNTKYRIEHVEVKDRSGRIKLKEFSSYYPVSI